MTDERIYNSGLVELTAGAVMMFVFFYLYGNASKVMLDASTLGTTTEELTLQVVSVILFLVLCGFLIGGAVIFRYGFTTFANFVIDAYNAQYEDWL